MPAGNIGHGLLGVSGMARSSTIAVGVVIGAALANTFRSSFDQASSKVDRLGDAIATLDGRTRQIAGLRTLRTEASQAGTAWNAARARVAELSAEMAKTSEPTARMQREFARAEAEAERARVTYGRKREALERLGASLTEAGIDVKRLTAEEARLGRETDALRRKFDALKTADAALSRIGQGWRDLRNQALVNTAGIAGAALTLAPAVAWDRQLRMLANTAGFSSDELAKVRAQINGLAPDTGQKVEELTRGLEILVGKGLDPGKALASLERVGSAALATGAEIEDLSTTAYSLIDNMKIAPEQMGKAFDMLAQAGKLGGFELRDMARDFPQLTAAAQALGMKGAEGIATLSTAVQVALKGAGSPSEAANNFANFLAKMTAPETVKRFADMGVDLADEFKEATDKGLDPVRWMLERIQDLTEGDQFKMGELFGDQQVLNFIKPMLANLSEYDRMRKEVLAADGVVDKDKARMAEASSVALDRARIAFGRVVAAFEVAIDPMITVLADAFTGLANSIAGVVEAAPGLTGVVAGVVGIGLALRSVFTVISIGRGALQLLGLRGAEAAGRVGLLGRAFRLVGGLLVPGLGTMLNLGAAMNGPVRAGALSAGGALRGLVRQAVGLGGAAFSGAGQAALGLGRVLLGLGRVALPVVIGAVRALGLALLMNPIGLAITAIAGGAVLLITYWDDVKAFFQGLWPAIEAGASAAWEVLKTVLSWTPAGLVVRLWQALPDGLAGVWSAVVDGASAAWNRVTDGISAAWDGLKAAIAWSPADLVTEAWSVLPDLLGGIWDRVLQAASAVWSRVSELVTAPIRSVRDTLGKAWNWVTGDGDGTAAGSSAPPQPSSTGGSGPAGGVAGLAARTGGGLAATAGTVAALAAPASAAPPPAVVDGGINMTFNFSITAAPGTDPQVLATEIRRQISQVLREAEARRRAANHD
ncbi:phage tail tape measure protein [Tistrella mobilis]|uniref:phage tail tape measure protein n=1 Tax=Tistrella mobilis TaxID=171437 RepID=UPI0035590252